MPALARFYDSQIGRFLTPDPAGTIDSPNLYAYVLNDPINFTDPSGLYADGCVVYTGSHIPRCPSELTHSTGGDGQESGGGGRGGGGGGRDPCANASADEICIPGRRMPPRFPFDTGPPALIFGPGGRGPSYDPAAIRNPPASGAIEDSLTPVDVALIVTGVKLEAVVGKGVARIFAKLFATKTAAQAAAKIGFKTQHYSSRLEAAGVNVGRAESAVAREIGAMRSNMTVGSDVRGRLTIDGVRIEYRARLLPNGSVNVGTVFPVAP